MEMWGSEIFGTDAAGHHLWVEKVTTIKATELLERFNDDAMMCRRAVLMEALEIHKGNALGVNTGVTVPYKHIYIMDLNGLQFGHFSGGVKRVVQNVIVEMGNLYPESVHKLMFVNAPFVFRAIWAMICPWLHQVTKDKTRIIGGGDAITKELLDCGFTIDNIPECFGGKHKGTPIKALIGKWREENQAAILAAAAGAKEEAKAE